MTRFMSIFSAVALVAGLTPIAANATIVTPLNYVQVQAHKAMSGPLPEIQHLASADAAHGLKGQTIVRSGAADQRYPDFLGG